MKLNKNILRIFLIFAFCLTLFFGLEKNVKADIYDDANLLSDVELTNIQTLIEKQEMNTGYEIIIYTFRGGNTGGSYQEKEDRLDAHLYDWYIYQTAPKLSNKPTKLKTVALAVDMDSRTLVIMTFDKLKHLDFSDNNSIVTNVTNYFKYEDYFGAFEYFIENIPSEITSKNLLKLLLHTLISIVIAAIIMIVLVIQSKGKVTVSARDYLNPTKTITKNSRDAYIRTVTTKTKIQTSSGGGGGGGGGSRSGGGGHGHF